MFFWNYLCFMKINRERAMMEARGAKIDSCNDT